MTTRQVEFTGGPLDTLTMTVEGAVVHAIDDNLRPWSYYLPRDWAEGVPWPGVQEAYALLPPKPVLPRPFRIANAFLRPLGLMLLPGDGRL